MQKKMIAICIIGMVLLTSIPTLSALEINETTNPIQSLSTANTIYVFLFLVEYIMKLLRLTNQ